MELFELGLVADHSYPLHPDDDDDDEDLVLWLVCLLRTSCQLN